ncbi:MAG: ATP-binding domain-containing protein, partial [Candidatus Methylumidiphilus sp.]
GVAIRNSDSWAQPGGADGAEVLAGFNRFRVLAAHHAGPASASSTNHAFEALQRERLRTPWYERWYLGRPIMVTRNDYGLRLFNGDVGVCLRVDGELRVCFEDAEGKLRTLAPARLPEYVPAYAITVHKSQGSEFDQALFLLPEIVSPVLNRPLVYTAVTRAKHRAEIWGGREMLAAAINRAPERSSGLRERLWG